MKRLVFAAVAGVAVAASAAQFKFGPHTITVPDGFEVELVAGPPLVDRPIEADFDEQGRLYVTDSSGLTDKAEKQLDERPHRVVRLEDTDGDGRYDKSIVFADKMMLPEGAMWHDGSLYVAAPPSIWKLTDTDGNGVADQREEWFQGKTLTGCANDLHGPYFGPDGWIYWTKGAFAKQTYERPGKPPFITRASHIFRSRVDGSGIEPVMTGGMDNPVAVVFTPAGERIFTTTFFQRPEAGRRDGLIHAVYGGAYGKPNEVLDDHKKTGDLMPVLTHMGPGVPCGLLRCNSKNFAEGDAVTLYACQFNLHKVSRHVLEPYGATFRTRDSDFLVSDDQDFHPTDVLEDADGSLLVVDTGGWYKICCPSSQLSKPDVLGAIYRVRKKGAPKIDDPRGLQIDWKAAENGTPAKMPALPVPKLVHLLDDARHVVAERAIQTLAMRRNNSIPALRAALKLSSATRKQKQNAIWALTRIDSPEARAGVRDGLQDKDDEVRLTALHSISFWRDNGASSKLIPLLESSKGAQIKRVAAEALGRIGDRAAVPALLAASAGTQSDRVLEHSIIYALIEIADSEATKKGLLAKSPRERRAALIALDQMEGGDLKPEDVVARLDDPEPLLRETAEWILQHRATWAEAMAPFFKTRLAANNFNEKQLDRLLKPFAGEQPMQKLLADVAGDTALSKRSRTLALRAMARSGVKETPAIWCSELERLLASDDPDILRDAIAATRALPPPKENARSFANALLAISHRQSSPPGLRLEALAALPSGTKLDDDSFRLVADHLNASKPVEIRSTAATVFSKARLSQEQLLTAAELIKETGPLEIGRLIPIFAKQTNEALGMQLLASLKASPGLPAVQPDTFRSQLTNFPVSVQQEADRILAAASSTTAEQQSRLEQLQAELPKGDIRRGQQIFNSSRTACASCHAIGYLGGALGPDLTRIGQVRTERDLLESIVFPSASFVRSYESTLVATKSGDQFNGVLRKDSPDEVVLATAADAEVRIPRTDVAEMRPGTISVMPEGLDQQLTRQELADLLAFLKATRW